jgi:phosphopantothenoylcysteine decarboxylase/phosphopantothenate--cysteine ligase
VADYRPRAPHAGKLRKDDADALQLALERTDDVLATLAERRRPGQVIVGFAAEHGPGGVDIARDKRVRKRLDAVVVNDISRGDIGFEEHFNEVTIVTARGERDVPRAPKAEVAAAVLDEVQALREHPDRTPDGATGAHSPGRA